MPFFTWQVIGGSLPDGLAINTTGLISGQPVTQGGAMSVTVEVRDAFNRADAATFTWTVLPPLLVTQPSAQASYTGSPITTLNVSATGGSGTPYTWSDPTGSLPPGLSLSTVSNKGRVTGTPTTVGSTRYRSPSPMPAPPDCERHLQLDHGLPADRRSDANLPPTAVNTAIASLPMTATGGHGTTNRWTGGASLPPGLGMASAA